MLQTPIGKSDTDSQVQKPISKRHVLAMRELELLMTADPHPGKNRKGRIIAQLRHIQKGLWILVWDLAILGIKAAARNNVHFQDVISF